MMADLIRTIDMPLCVGFVSASSYRGPTTEAGRLTIDTTSLPDIRGRDVLLVDDIFDTGRTLERILGELRARKPNSIRSAALLWKEGRSQVDFEPDYHGFRIPNRFVVGYGLDFDEQYRHLPYIATVNTGTGPANEDAD